MHIGSCRITSRSLERNDARRKAATETDSNQTLRAATPRIFRPGFDRISPAPTRGAFTPFRIFDLVGTAEFCALEFSRSKVRLWRGARCLRGGCNDRRIGRLV